VKSIMLAIKEFWQITEKKAGNLNCFSHLILKMSHTRKRIVVWNILIVAFLLLIITGLSTSMFSLASFLPVLLLLGIYGALSIYDTRRFLKYQKMQKEFTLNFQTTDGRISTFLQEGAQVKLIQMHDISVVDKYGNCLIILLLKKEWLVEIQYIDGAHPFYHSFRFDEFPKKTVWTSKEKNKEPRWHEAIERLKPISAGDDKNLIQDQNTDS